MLEPSIRSLQSLPGDFRARPALKVVVSRLEATFPAGLDDFLGKPSSFDEEGGAKIGNDEDANPTFVISSLLRATIVDQAATIERMAARIAALE